MTPTRPADASCGSLRRWWLPGSAVAFGGDTRAGGGGEVGVELDATPVSAEVFGGHGGGAAAHERVEHDPRLPVGVAGAGGGQGGAGGGAAERADDFASPRCSASGAAGFGAAGGDHALGQGQREDGVVGASVAARGDGPHVAGVLAQRMPGPALSLECLQAGRGHAVRSPPRFPRLVGRFARTCVAAAMTDGAQGLADGVEVEEVPRMSGQDVDDLVGAVEAVGDAGRDRVAFGPHDFVADDPAVLLETQRQAFGCHQQTLPLSALGGVAGVGVAEVEPVGAGRYQDSSDLAADCRQVLDPGVDVGFETDLAVGVVVAEPEVWRAGDDAVDRSIRYRLELCERVTLDDPVSR